MKIAMLTDLFYPYQLGGAERNFYEIAKRLSKKHEVHVFTMNLAGVASEQNVGKIHVHRFGLRHSMKKRSLLSFFSYLASFPLIVPKLSRFDIVHSNQAAGVFSMVSPKPFVETIHDVYLNEWEKYYGFPFHYIGRVLETAMLKGRYAKTIAVSESSKAKIEKNSKLKPVVIQNGIDVKFINSVKARKKNSVVYAGRLVNYKKVDVLIRAMKKVQHDFPGTELVIIGSGEESERLKKLVMDIGVNARFTGFVSEKEKIREIKSARVFVSMSVIEGFGISLLEAMACKTPVIARHLKCYDEFCTEKNIVFSGQENLSKKIIMLLKNGKMSKKISENGFKTAMEFDWEKMAQKIEKQYEKIKDSGCK